METQDYPPKPYEAVAAEVRAWLARRQISGRSAASQLGMTEIYLNRRLRGAVAFNVIDLSAIANLLNVPITVFFESPDRGGMPTGAGYLRFPAEQAFGRAA
jgi:transcriptional regulator with XRE-family HTH domain